MDDEAESSQAGPRRAEGSPGPTDHVPATADLDEAEDERVQAVFARERRLDAKRKRIRMLDALLRDLDMVVYMELITIYHVECAHAFPSYMSNC